MSKTTIINASIIMLGLAAVAALLFYYRKKNKETIQSTAKGNESGKSVTDRPGSLSAFSDSRVSLSGYSDEATGKIPTALSVTNRPGSLRLYSDESTGN